MKTRRSAAARYSYGLTRREYMRTGGLGLFGITLPKLLYGTQPDAQAVSTGASASPLVGLPPARSCILVYLLGGPSHLDMWDLKPEAPAEIRGPFQPIATSVPGVHISEHLPMLARQADRYTIVRSVSHPNHFHTHMIYYTLTGRHMRNPNADDNVPNRPSRTDHPHVGSLVAYGLGRRVTEAATRARASPPPAEESLRDPAHVLPGLPEYVALPELSIRKRPISLPGGNAGFLGPRYDPLAVNGDPREPGSIPALARPAEVGHDRLARRHALRAVLDGRCTDSRRLREYEALYQSAMDLVGRDSSDAFRLDLEPAELRERYGTHRFGQSLLLARRLVEAGVAFTAVHFNYMSECDGWDTHSNNFACLEGELLPLLDQGLSALLDDLAARGLLEETLVVTMGEFGRTPRINANAGRDHWGHCASAVLAGGGVQGGRVIGASDATASYPASHPVDPADIVTTVCARLGLDPATLVRDQLDRPMPLAAGRVVYELF